MTAISTAARTRANRERKKVFTYIKILVFLAPLPFGCVAEPWRHLFFIALALIAYSAWRQPGEGDRLPAPASERKDPARDLLYGRHQPGKPKGRGAMTWAARLWVGFFLFCAFQLLPLPAVIVKMLSPQTMAIITRLRGAQPAWLTLSLVPRETVVFFFELLVLTAFGMALGRLRPGWREMTSLVRTLGWTAAFQVCFGLTRLISGSPNFFLFFAPWKSKSGDLTGTLVNSNHFAFFLEMTAPLILALIAIEFASRGGKWLTRIFDTLERQPRVTTLLLIFLLMITGVTMTNSRAGLTALFVGLVVAGLMMMRSQKAGLQRFIPLISTLVILLVVVVAGGQTWKGFKKLSRDLDDGIARIQRWPSVLEMAGDFPLLGTGMGTFRWAYFPYDKEANQWVTHAHNDVLETATDAGLVGFILIMGAFFAFSAAVLFRWRERRRVSVRLLAAGGVAAITAAFFHSFFDFSLRIPSNALVLVIIMTLTWRVVQYRKTSSRPHSLREGGSL